LYLFRSVLISVKLLKSTYCFVIRDWFSFILFWIISSGACGEMLLHDVYFPLYLNLIDYYIFPSSDSLLMNLFLIVFLNVECSKKPFSKMVFSGSYIRFITWWYRGETKLAEMASLGVNGTLISSITSSLWIISCDFGVYVLLDG